MPEMLFPTFLKLGGRRVLLVGGGTVAAGKLSGLLDAGARVRVVAPAITPRIASAPVEIAERPFEPEDLDGVCFVVAAAPPDVNRVVATAADARGIFVNAVDDVENASAYAGAVLRKAGVTIALSTDGVAPALAGLLREALEVVLPNDLDAWVQCASEARRHWIKDGIPITDRRPLLLEALIAIYASRQSPVGSRQSQSAVAVNSRSQESAAPLDLARGALSPVEGRRECGM